MTERKKRAAKLAEARRLVALWLKTGDRDAGWRGNELAKEPGLDELEVNLADADTTEGGDPAGD